LLKFSFIAIINQLHRACSKRPFLVPGNEATLKKQAPRERQTKAGTIQREKQHNTAMERGKAQH